MTVVYVTHDQEEAMNMSDRIAIMNRGRIEQVGPPAEIYERPANIFVGRFLGEANLIEGRVEDVAGGVATLRVAAGLHLASAARRQRRRRERQPFRPAGAGCARHGRRWRGRPSGEPRSGPASAGSRSSATSSATPSRSTPAALITVDVQNAAQPPYRRGRAGDASRGRWPTA